MLTGLGVKPGNRQARTSIEIKLQLAENGREGESAMLTKDG